MSARRLAGVGLLCGAVLGAAPALASPGGTADGLAARIVGASPLLPSPELQRYVAMVGATVAAASGHPGPWRFGVVSADSVNALAVPGGHVFVSRGLLRLLKSEDELAFVLAHEVAHLARRHHDAVVQQQRLAVEAVQAVERLARDDPQSRPADEARLGDASARLFARGLDQGAEYEADRLGVEWMLRAGYDPAAALGVLEALMGFAPSDDRARWLFMTHPSPSARIDRLLRQGIDELPRPQVPSAHRDARFGRVPGWLGR